MLKRMYKLLLVWAFATLLIPSQLFAQTVIKGTIRSSVDQMPLEGVSVVIKGTKIGTQSNVSGQFSITAKNGDGLEISFIGYSSQLISITTATASLDVKLTPLKKELDEVIVVGYGTQKKANITGSVSTIKMDDLLGSRPVSSTGALLQGAIPGLQVTTGSGQPGASTNFNIRGGTDFGTSATSSINTGSPFILLDNVPFNGALNLIDPNDIESITVLKDAGSAAIYGARSAFGVVLVTTKKGNKNQKTQFTYNNNLVFANPTNLPTKASPIQQVQSWIDGGMTPAYVGNQNLKTWMELLNAYQATPDLYSSGNTVSGGVYYQLAPTDAIKALLGNSAFQQMHNFALSGGSDKTTYRISLGTTNEDGIMVPTSKQDNYKRYNIKSLVSSDITSWMTAQLDAGYSTSTSTTPFNTGAFSDATTSPSVIALDSIPTVVGLMATSKNLIMASAPNIVRNDVTRITARTILKPLKGLTITGEYTIDNARNLATSYDKRAGGFVNQFTYVAMTIGADKFTKSNSSTDYKAINLFATYVKSIGKNNFTLTGGFNQESSHYEIASVTSSGSINANLPSISGTTGLIPLTGYDNYLEYSTRGLFGRLNYDYKNKYLFQVNARNDGSSKFPDGRRWGFFPSVSAGWRITEEDFMNFIKPVLSELKLRGSLGTVGNQNIGDYQFFGGMTSYTPNWLYGGAQVGTLNTPPLVSNSFTWATVETIDYGIDFGFFKNRLTGSYDWYQRDTKDILTSNPTPLPALLGTGAPLQNAGSLRTTGFELQLNWRDKIGQFSYSLGANLFDYESEVTNANNKKNVITNGTLYIGKKMGGIWGYTTDRFYNTNDFASGTLNASYRNGTLNPGIPKQNGQAPNPGDIVYVDYDKNGIITSGAGTMADHGDLQIIGNNSLRYQYGFNGSVAYKFIDLSFVIAGVGKQEQWTNNTFAFPNQWLIYGGLYAHQVNYWTPTNTESFFGRIYTDNVNTPNQGFNQITQTKFLQNGSYTRVKNITVRYTVPAELLKKAAINKMQFYVSLENPFMFHRMPDGMYPDMSSMGSGAGLGYPFMRKTSVGLSISY